MLKHNATSFSEAMVDEVVTLDELDSDHGKYFCPWQGVRPSTQPFKMKDVTSGFSSLRGTSYPLTKLDCIGSEGSICVWHQRRYSPFFGGNCVIRYPLALTHLIGPRWNKSYALQEGSRKQTSTIACTLNIKY